MQSNALRSVLHPRQIRTRAKVITGPLHDQTSNRGIRIDGRKGGGQLLNGDVGEGVLFLRTIDRERGDVRFIHLNLKTSEEGGHRAGCDDRRRWKCIADTKPMRFWEFARSSRGNNGE